MKRAASRSALGVVLGVILLLANRPANAQTVTVSGPATLTIITAVAGSQPTAVTHATTTYTATTPNPNGRLYKITAQLDANMPANVTLTATLAAPPGGSVSVGTVVLDVTARDMITGMGRNVNSTQAITYQLSATVLAGVLSTSRIVTYTIVRTL